MLHTEICVVVHCHKGWICVLLFEPPWKDIQCRILAVEQGSGPLTSLSVCLPCSWTHFILELLLCPCGDKVSAMCTSQSSCGSRCVSGAGWFKEASRAKLERAERCYVRTSFIRRYIGLHRFFSHFPTPKPMYDTILRFRLCTMWSYVLFVYDTIWWFSRVRYQSRSHCYYNT